MMGYLQDLSCLTGMPTHVHPPSLNLSVGSLRPASFSTHITQTQTYGKHLEEPQHCTQDKLVQDLVSHNKKRHQYF